MPKFISSWVLLLLFSGHNKNLQKLEIGKIMNVNVKNRLVYWTSKCQKLWQPLNHNSVGYEVILRHGRSRRSSLRQRRRGRWRRHDFTVLLQAWPLRSLSSSDRTGLLCGRTLLVLLPTLHLHPNPVTQTQNYPRQWHQQPGRQKTIGLCSAGCDEGNGPSIPQRPTGHDRRFQRPTCFSFQAPFGSLDRFQRFEKVTSCPTECKEIEERTCLSLNT